MYQSNTALDIIDLLCLQLAGIVPEFENNDIILRTFTYNSEERTIALSIVGPVDYDLPVIFHVLMQQLNFPETKAVT